MIDFVTNKVIYDELVNPPSLITDYLTLSVHKLYVSALRNPKRSFSGITAAALEPIITTLVDVQAHNNNIIDDPARSFARIRLTRATTLAPTCIDTALIFHHPRGRPLKQGLAWLTRKWLGHTIQNRGPGGHDPEEDARACIDLLKAKIKNGTVPTHPPLPLHGHLIRRIVRLF